MRAEKETDRKKERYSGLNESIVMDRPSRSEASVANRRSLG